MYMVGHGWGISWIDWCLFD